MMKTNILTMIEQSEVAWKPLGEVGEVTKLAGFEFTNYVNYSDTGNIIALRGLNVKGELDLTDVKYIDNSDFSKLSRSKLFIDDMLFTYVGTVGNVALIPENDKYYLAPNVARIRFKNKDFILPRFAFYYFQTNYFLNKQMGKYLSSSSMKNLTMENIRKFQIPIPPLELQKEIVKRLDILTELEATLEAELSLRKKQYQYYRDFLLSENELAKVGVEWKTLGEVASYSKSRISFEKLDESNYVGVDNLLQNRAGKTLSNYVPTSGNLTEFIKDDILIGNIRPYLKKIWHADCMGGTNGDVLVIRVMSQKINPRYLYQVLADDKFFDYNMKHAKGAKMPRGNKEAILNYQIPIPSLETQAKIVAILDKFDRLTSSITDGLPKEIELRRKQYEYYRELLLNFPKV